MPYGGWNGAAEGLKTGMMLGNQFNETQMKRDALMQEQVKAKLAQYGKMLEASTASLKTTIESMPDRSDPNAAKIIDTQKDQLIQTAKIIGTLDPQSGQMYEQMVNNVYTNTKDKATQYTDAATGKTKEAQINAAAYGKAMSAGQSQPTAGTPTPSGPMAPPPGPAMEAPNQQVAMEPQAGLTSTAAAEPAMPMPDMAPDAAPVGQPPAAMPAGGPAGGPAAAPAPQVAGGMDPQKTAEQEYMRRFWESQVPKTPMEQGMEEGWRKEFFSMQPTVQAAERAIQTNARARQLLKEGIYTGWTASIGLAGGKITGNDREKVRRTEEFKALLGQSIGPQLKQFGSATAVSNLDLQTVEQYIGKDITLNEESIEAILKMNEEGARNTINNYNRIAPKVGQSPIDFPAEPQGQGAQPGFMPMPDGRIQLGPNTFLKVIQ